MQAQIDAEIAEEKALDDDMTVTSAQSTMGSDPGEIESLAAAGLSEADQLQMHGKLSNAFA